MTIKKKLKNLVIIIPARLMSERLSKKLLRKIDKVPMIVRVAKSAISCKLGEVYVATDSKQIFNICKTFSLENKNQQKNLIETIKQNCRRIVREKTGKKPFTNINIARI